MSAEEALARAEKLLERVEEAPPGHGEDLLRADSAEHGKPFDPKAEETAAWEAFDATSGT